VGKSALVAEKAAGSAWRMVPLTLDEPGDADAPALSSVFDTAGNRVGLVTSGGWSFTLGKSVALAFVRPHCEPAGTKVLVDIFGTRTAATVQSEPLYDPTNERLRA
ncbi:MAG: glycine cleavage T C-terminal barrel domain-containing protein, partial [Ilumatobacteraceae bacterium]